VTEAEALALWVLDWVDDGDRPGLQDPADFAASIRPDDEPPTLRVPPHGRRPVFTDGAVSEVPEVRYDTEHATMVGLLAAGYADTTGPNAIAVYGGLEPAESDALCLARGELCARADRLGRGRR